MMRLSASRDDAAAVRFLTSGYQNDVHEGGKDMARNGVSTPILWVLVVVSTGCAIGNRYPYRTLALEPELSGGGTVCIATQDRRPYVVTGSKRPQFVGIMRGGYGNVFEVNTQGDQPLADDITGAIVAGLDRRGFKATGIVVDSSAALSEIKQRMQKSGARRGLLLVLREWKTDTYNNTGLYYDVSVAVLNQAGAVLSEKDFKGKDDLGGSFWEPVGAARKVVPLGAKARLDALLSDGSVAAAMK